MEALKRILLVQDDPKDLDLTLTTLGEDRLANGIMVVLDGVEALDQRESRALEEACTPGAKASVAETGSLQRIRRSHHGNRRFGALLNEPMPVSVKRP